MYTFEIKRKVEAPAEVVWNVIADLERYAEYAPNLSKAKVIGGSGVGLRRQCWDTRGQSWKEECVLWQEGKSYAIKVDTRDYPYPFSYMQGVWGLEETADGIWIMMKFDYQPKFDPPIIGRVMNKMIQRGSFRPIVEKLMDNWEAEIRRRSH